MSYENQPQSSSSGVVIAIVAVVVLLLLGCVVVVGLAAVFWVRASAPVMVYDEPMRPTVSESVTVKAPATMDVPAQPQVEGAGDVRTVTIELDEQAKLLADGKPVDLEALATLLRSARAEQASPLKAVVRVDRKCPFEHVAAVQKVCREAGIDSVQIQARDATQE